MARLTRHLTAVTAALVIAASAFCTTAVAAEVIIVASNPGPIAGSGRDLAFDLSAVTGPIDRASLEIELDYSRTRELDIRLIEASGAIVLPIAALDSAADSSSLRGRYRFRDDALATWVQAAAQAAGGPLASGYATRAFQRGLDGSQCLNRIDRFLAYDIDRVTPLTLRIARGHGGATGSGSVLSARLRIESGRGDAIFASSIDEPAATVTRCRRAALDLLPNGGTEGLHDSPLAQLHYGAGGLDWYVGQTQPPLNVGPIGLGDATSRVYVGRFGGRSRLNFGFWDAATGTLNFTTGAGGHSLPLPGDWTTTEHYPIPGDYDGDGVTELAMAFLGQLGGEPRWFARVRFSTTDALRDFVIDPRASAGAGFQSGQIGFGAGQDSNLDGFDEITQYVRVSPAGSAMSMVVWNVRPEFAQAEGFTTASWGLVGDVMVLGRWIDSPGPGNRFGQMVVRRTPGGLDWYRFGNPVPTRFGLADDQPISINVDADVQHEIAVYRPSTQRIYAIRSSDGVLVDALVPGPVAGTPGFVYALGFLQGTLALPLF